MREWCTHDQSPRIWVLLTASCCAARNATGWDSGTTPRKEMGSEPETTKKGLTVPSGAPPGQVHPERTGPSACPACSRLNRAHCYRDRLAHLPLLTLRPRGHTMRKLLFVVLSLLRLSKQFRGTSRGRGRGRGRQRNLMRYGAERLLRGFFGGKR